MVKLIQFSLKFIIFIVLSVAVAESCPSQCKCSKEDTIIDCSNKGLTSIPTGIPTTATHIILSKNRIGSIEDKAFDGLSNVLHLDLRHNLISKFGALAFEGLNQLQTLFLSQNLLKDDTDFTSIFQLPHIINLFLSFNLFTKIPPIQIPNLRNLVLDGNKIESANFPDSFKQCALLSSIVLSNNMIRAIASIDFANLENLNIKSLLLKQNSITSVDPAAFVPVANSLETLNMDNNLLNDEMVKSVLEGFKEAGIPKLLTFSLNSNRINAVKSDLFAALNNGKLRNLQLDYNLLKSTSPDGLAPIASNLMLLSLRGCGLESFSFDLTSLQSLKSLVLDDNKLTSLPLNLPETLEILKFSKNRISSWPGNAFAAMDSLKVLDLSKNKITVIVGDEKTSSIADIYSTIKSFSASGNPWNCTCDLAWFIRWAQKNPKTVVNWNKYRCTSPTELSNTLVKNFDVSSCGKSEYVGDDNSDETVTTDSQKEHKESHHHKQKEGLKEEHEHEKGHKDHHKHKSEL